MVLRGWCVKQITGIKLRATHDDPKSVISVRFQSPAGILDAVHERLIETYVRWILSTRWMVAALPISDAALRDGFLSCQQLTTRSDYRHSTRYSKTTCTDNPTSASRGMNRAAVVAVGANQCSTIFSLPRMDRRSGPRLSALAWNWQRTLRRELW